MWNRWAVVRGWSGGEGGDTLRWAWFLGDSPDPPNRRDTNIPGSRNARGCTAIFQQRDRLLRASFQGKGSDSRLIKSVTMSRG
jgi:hypothetical protein